MKGLSTVLSLAAAAQLALVPTWCFAATSDMQTSPDLVALGGSGCAAPSQHKHHRARRIHLRRNAAAPTYQSTSTSSTTTESPQVINQPAAENPTPPATVTSQQVTQTTSAPAANSRSHK